jgi:hypothetical protein
MQAYHSPGSAVGGKLTGEFLLLAAVLRQLFKDAHSQRQAIREDAQAVLRDPCAMAFWADVVGVDADAFQAAVQRTLARRQG